MQKIHFSIQINAPVEKVWDTMLTDETYRQWTEAFGPGSYFKGNWEEGTEIQFLNTEDDGTTMGMHSRIAENRKHEFVSIEHLGIVKDGVVDTASEEATKWAPSFENYTFKEVDGGTEVSVDQDMQEEYKEMFEVMWPKALQTLKELSEK